MLETSLGGGRPPTARELDLAQRCQEGGGAELVVHRESVGPGEVEGAGKEDPSP